MVEDKQRKLQDTHIYIFSPLSGSYKIYKEREIVGLADDTKGKTCSYGKAVEEGICALHRGQETKSGLL